MIVKYILLIFISINLFSVEIEKNINYNGPIKLTAANLGVSLGLNFMQNAFLNDKQLIVKNTNTNQTIFVTNIRDYNRDIFTYNIMIKNHKYILVNKKQIRTNLSLGIYEALNSDIVLQRFLLKSTSLRALVIETFSQKHMYTSANMEVNKFINKITFTPLKPLDNSKNNYESTLQGKHFVIIDKDKKHQVWLCSNKNFRIISNHTLYYGVWEVNKNNLKLNFDNNLVRNFSLKTQNNSIIINNNRAFFLANNFCR